MLADDADWERACRGSHLPMSDGPRHVKPQVVESSHAGSLLSFRSTTQLLASPLH